MKSRRFSFLLFVPFLISSCCSKNTQQSECYMNEGWQLEASSALAHSGQEISLSAFTYDNWKEITLPSTVLSSLRQNGAYQDIYVGNNMEKVPTRQFEESWWYRKEFKIENFKAGEFYQLFFEGLNYSANIWLNGELLATRSQIEGPYAMHKLDITKLAKANNVVAVEVFPPGKTDLTIGFVDWNPNTPDKNMGLWRGVQLLRSQAVVIDNIVITSDIAFDIDTIANLKIDAELRNLSDVAVAGILKADIDNDITLDIPYQLAAGETKRFIANANTHEQLQIVSPRLWWPVNMGKPELYDANFSLYVGDNLSFERNERFGIRKIEDYMFAYAPNGVFLDSIRGYKINEQKVLLRGGGWVDDMMLADTPEKVRAQVEYVKHMNLNTIRLEGFWGNTKDIYNACDENGILLMIGLSCQWEWKGYCGREEHAFLNVETAEDIELISKSYQDQVKWGMNNPSIFLWVCASDKLPLPAFEREWLRRIKEYDTDRLTLSTCKGRHAETHHLQVSEVSGVPGSKMLGPYEYVPPMYWYHDKVFGGAYGFNTETGPGSQIPPIESIRKMLDNEDLQDINGEGWQYHLGRNEFQTLERFLHAYNQRYWKVNTAEELAFNVQISNYEAIRAMFEAFEINRTTTTTGLIQWMLNSAWPEMYWQLYDWYLNPNGAFYGVKTATQPLNLIYDYVTKEVAWTNNTPQDKKLRAEVKMLDINSKEFFAKSIDVNMTSFSVGEFLTITAESPSETYFLSLKLYDDQNNEVSNNFYWLSSKEDKMDYSQTTWVYSPQSEFASFKQLKEMPQADLDIQVEYRDIPTGVEVITTLTNTSNVISFFNELRVVNKDTGLNVLPVFWSDNYVSLLPNETRILKATMNAKKADVELLIKGFNSNK